MLDRLKSKRAKFVLLIGMGFFIFLSPLQGEIARLEISASYFYPFEKAFRNIYGKGVKYGFDIGRDIWKNLELHIEFHYYYKRGKLTYTRERTRVIIRPLGAQLRYVFLKKKVHLYAGGGLTYNIFEERNPIGTVKESKFGFSVRTGGYTRIKGLKKVVKEFIIDIYISYNYCRMKPVEIGFNIGGLDTGVAVGFTF
jgi:hypothetical protein